MFYKIKNDAIILTSLTLLGVIQLTQTAFNSVLLQRNSTKTIKFHGEVNDELITPTLSIFQLETTADSNYAVMLNELAANYNGTGNETDWLDMDPNCFHGANTLGHILTTVLYAIVCIIGLCGNTLVIYVVLRFSKMQTVTNIYILNLAIADECFLVGIPFLLYTMQIGSWKFGEYMCKAYMVSTSVTQFTSSIFLLIMAADRYIAVCHPISSQRYRTPLVSKMVSCFAWLTSVLLMLPVILFASTVERNEHISCNIKWPEDQHTQSGTSFILYTLSLGFATPLTFILIFYFLVIYKLHTVGPKQKSKERKRSHRKVTKLVMTVITVYVLCWLPYWISQVVLISTTPSTCVTRLEIMVFLLVGCLGYSNSAMNPLMYAFLSDNFKKCFMKAFSCVSKWHTNAEHSSNTLQVIHNFLTKCCFCCRESTRQSSKQLSLLTAHNNNVTTNLLTTSAAYGTGNTATSTLADVISDVSLTNDDSATEAVCAGNTDDVGGVATVAAKSHDTSININLNVVSRQLTKNSSMHNNSLRFVDEAIDDDDNGVGVHVDVGDSNDNVAMAVVDNDNVNTSSFSTSVLHTDL